MTRLEEYKNAITNYGVNFCEQFVEPQILNRESCAGIGCHTCRIIQLAWLLTEPEPEPEAEPEIDWSTVEVDTPILVRDYESKTWMKRHFAKYENGTVYAWFSGGTSWSCGNEKNGTIPYKYAKLAEEVDDGTN